MRRIANKILCYSVAMLLLLFGLNFDEAEALFYTSNIQTESVSSAVYTGEATISSVESFATEIMSIKSESPVQQLVKHSASSKRDARNLLYILKTDIISDYNSNFVMVTESDVFLDIHHRVAVLNYIHDLDGKKRV